MKLNLLVLTPGKMEGKALEVKVPQFVIGRDPDCQLRPASPLISKRHCAFVLRDGKAFLEDYGSTNGSFVNDERVEGERELHQDDRVKIGPLLFSVQIQAPAPTGKTPVPATKQPVGKTPPPATRAAGTKPAPKPAGATPPPAAAAKAPPAKAPPAKVPAAKSASSDEDDVMSMLLDVDDGTPVGQDVPRDPDGVPEGSTVLDMKIPEGVLNAANQPKKDEKKPASTGDTRSAAAKILEQMTRRPRS